MTIIYNSDGSITATSEIVDINVVKISRQSKIPYEDALAWVKTDFFKAMWGAVREEQNDKKF